MVTVRFFLEPPVFDAAASYRWSPDQALTITGVGSLMAEPLAGQGISSALIAGKQLAVRFRQGGERCRPAGRQHSQSLKKLLQEFVVETWWRDRLPLIYCDEVLIAVADLWVCEDWAAADGDQGLLLKLNKCQ